MTRVSVFIAASIDGYIATLDDKLDWLDAAVLPGEDYGYDEFIATVDVVAMGRGTYDFISGIDQLPYGDRHVYVFTHRPPAPRRGATFWQVTAREAVAHWERAGAQHVYLDGGVLISSFLAEDLIDDMVLTTAPVLLGQGRRLFHPGGQLTAMRLDRVQSWPSGMVNRWYSRR